MQILILGMHRSGTSMLTRMLHAMGVYIGAESMLLPANPDNPKGFWERRDVIRANGLLLNHFGGTWYKVDSFDDTNLAGIPSEITSLIKNIIDELDPHQPWAIKDPRLCITLPVWLSKLKKPTCLIVSRDPREIAQSLKLRNNIPIEYGLALWEFHAASIIRHTHALSKFFVQHESLIAKPTQALAQLQEGLQKHGIKGLHAPSTSLTDAFFDSSLRRAFARDVLQVLTPHQQKLAAMLSGNAPMEAMVKASSEAARIMASLGYQLNAAAVNQ